MKQTAGGPWRLRRSHLVLGMLYLYCFLSPLGSLVRFGDAEGTYGITTLLLGIIALSTAALALRVVQRNRILMSFAMLITWIFFASFLASEPLETLVRSGQLFIYLTAAAAAYYYVHDENKALVLLAVLCSGGLISSSATIIDFMGFIDIPGINESSIATKTSVGYVFQASGSFARRSAMGAYYCIIITVGILFATLGSHLHLTSRLFFGLTGVSCLVALMLTHNRAGVLGASIASAMLILTQSNSPVRIVMHLLIGSVLLSALVFITSHWFPGVWHAYAALFGVGDASGIDTTESDELRFVLLLHSLKTLAENPLGHGFSNMTGVPGLDHDIDPHSGFTQIIWGAGLFGLIWLVVLLTRGAKSILKFLMKRESRSRQREVGLALVGGMVAFAIFNLSHAPIGTGTAWILFGVMLRLAI